MGCGNRRRVGHSATTKLPYVWILYIANVLGPNVLSTARAPSVSVSRAVRMLSERNELRTSLALNLDVPFNMSLPVLLSIHINKI